VEIATPRLLLRELGPGDAPAFVAYHADPRNAEFAGPDEAGPVHAGALLELFARWAAERPRRNYQLAIAARDPPHRLLGCCGLRGGGLEPGVAEFGIELAPDEWGRGYASECARALLDAGFAELGLHEVRGVSVSANARVARLLRRLGFVPTIARDGPPWMRARGWREQEWRLTRRRWLRAAGRHAPHR
jgi:RimJ/RimL family protein N-acetyltransferase